MSTNTNRIINADNIMYGDKKVNRVYMGDTQLWERTYIYGWHINPNESDPDNAITYLEEATNKNPAYMDTTAFNYGDWENVFFIPKPCMVKGDGTVDYYLNKNDYSFIKGIDIDSITLSNEVELGGIDNTNGSNINTNGRVRTIGYIEIDVGTTGLYASPKIIYNSSSAIINNTMAHTYIYQYNSSHNYLQMNSGLPTSLIEINPNTKYIRLTYGANAYAGTLSPAIIGNAFILSSTPCRTNIYDVSYNGNAMMEWPKIWYKFVAGSVIGEGSFYCSNKQVDSSYKCWCNYDYYGNQIDHFYTAIYNGTGTTKLRSLSGIYLTEANGSGNVATNVEIANAEANNINSNKTWYIGQYSDRLLINSLLVLISKSLNTRAKFGNGLVGNNNTTIQNQKDNYLTGTLNNKGLFYGSTTVENEGMKVFGMENYWGCVFHRIAGLIANDDDYHIKLTRSTIDGTTATDYSFTDSTGYLTEQDYLPTTSGNISKMMFTSLGYLPCNTTNGSISTYWCNWLDSSVNQTDYYALMGGILDTRTGAFEIDFTNATNVWSISSTLSCKPFMLIPPLPPAPSFMQGITVPQSLLTEATVESSDFYLDIPTRYNDYGTIFYHRYFFDTFREIEFKIISNKLIMIPKGKFTHLRLRYQRNNWSIDIKSETWTIPSSPTDSYEVNNRKTGPDGLVAATTPFVDVWS